MRELANSIQQLQEQLQAQQEAHAAQAKRFRSELESQREVLSEAKQSDTCNGAVAANEAAIHTKRLAMGTQQAEMQRMHACPLLANSDKESRPLLVWPVREEQQLYDIFDQLDGLRVPATVQDLQVSSMHSSRNDRCCADAVQGMTRNTDWDITRTRSALEGTCHVQVANALVSNGCSHQECETITHTESEQRLVSRAIRFAAAKTAEDKQDSPAADPASGGNGKERSTPEAEREANNTVTATCESLANGVCKPNLSDACSWGDSGWQRHVTIEKLKAEAEQRNKESAKKQKALKSDLDKEETKTDKGSSRSEFTSINQCLQFQIMDVNPRQIDMESQFAYLAKVVGLAPHEFEWPGEKMHTQCGTNVDGNKRVRQANQNLGGGEYQHKAMFDTGADISLTFDKTIIHDFKIFPEPRIVEGVGGIEIKYDAGGKLILQMGDQRKTVPVYYSAAETSTLIAGSEFDTGDWHIELRNGCRFYFENKELAHFPRAVATDLPLPRGFKNSLSPRQEARGSVPMRSSASNDVNGDRNDGQSEGRHQTGGELNGSNPSEAKELDRRGSLGASITSTRSEQSADWLSSLDSGKQNNDILALFWNTHPDCNYILLQQPFNKHCPEQMRLKAVEADLPIAMEVEELGGFPGCVGMRTHTAISLAPERMSCDPTMDQSRVFDRGRE